MEQALQCQSLTKPMMRDGHADSLASMILMGNASWVHSSRPELWMCRSRSEKRNKVIPFGSRQMTSPAKFMSLTAEDIDSRESALVMT